ncbi:MAG: CoA transferase, partial [Chloroflexota bacterium]
ARFLRTRTKREIMDRAVRDKVNLAPIYNTADLLEDPQLRARGFWQQVGGRTHPGPFAQCSGTPIRLGAAAPLLGEALPGEPETIWRSYPRLGGPAARLSGMASGPGAGQGAFTGINVADFSWVGVGPLIAKTLADHGATVVRVESAAHPDYLRLIPPFKDGLPGLDRAQFFANFNTSKLGLALDFGTAAGLELAHRLIGWSDVVIESFSPGTLERHGLDYGSISQGRPDLIMLSTSLRGQTGPERSFSGFGSQGVRLAGLHGITGWPDRPPAGPWGAYTDFVANRYGVAVLAAAILHRGHTGRGQHIDLSQVEAAIHFVEPLVLDYTVNGRVAQRAGQHSDRHCPHGVYQTAGAERYVAVDVETAEQWNALRTLAPLEGFGGPGFASLEARLRYRDAIDLSLRAWARTQEPRQLAATLQKAGVPAFVVQRPTDL